MKNSIKLHDIAQALGVSASTVSRALNNHSRISDSTKSKVLEQAKLLSYNATSTARLRFAHKRFRIVVLCPYDIFFSSVISGMKTVLNGKAGQLVDVDYHFFDVYDVVKQTNKLQLIHDDHSIDAVAIAPAHPYMLNPLINKLVEHDKKVITFNTDAPQSRRACYIGQNAAVAGRMAAHLAGSLVRGDEKIAIFNSFSVTSGLVERKHSFLEYLKSGDLHADIVGPFEYYDTIESAQEIVMQVLKLNPSIKSIYANNMVGTIGCARAVRESGNQGKMCVVGFDDNAEIRDHMADHIISYTILQEPITQGMDTIMTLLDWLVNDIAPESEMMYIPCSILMKANMDYLPCGVAGRIGKTGHSSSEDSFAAPIVTCS